MGFAALNPSYQAVFRILCYRPLMQPPFTTYFIVGLTCLVSFLAFDNKRLMGELILWPPAVHKKGQWYRLVTYGVVHANGSHLLVNMITLYFFGRVIEYVLAV